MNFKKDIEASKTCCNERCFCTRDDTERYRCTKRYGCTAYIPKKVYHQQLELF